MKTSGKKGSGSRRGAPAKKSRQRAADGNPPEWAHGLRQLYDSVVSEPLPDAFKDLLDKLDKKK